MPIISLEFINKHRTANGAWTKAQMQVLGIPWPQPTGWKSAIFGKVISDEQAKAFEDARLKFTGKTIRAKAKAEIKDLKARGLPVPEELAAKVLPPPQIAPTNPKSIRRAEKKRLKKERAKAAKELLASIAGHQSATAPTPQKPQPAKATKRQRHKARQSRPVVVESWAPKIRAESGCVTVRGIPVTGDDFLQTYEWRRVRMMALKKYGPVCQCCGATPATGAVMNVDHIKPRKLFPQLALDVDNLQVLCHECNHGKGNWDMTDWRPAGVDQLDADSLAHIRAIGRE